MKTTRIKYDDTSTEAVLPENKDGDFAILFNASQEEIFRNVQDIYNENLNLSELIVCMAEDKSE